LKQHYFQIQPMSVSAI